MRLLSHPLPTSPRLFAHPRRAPSLARFFARLFDLRLEKLEIRNGCCAGYESPEIIVSKILKIKPLSTGHPPSFLLFVPM